MSSNQIDSAVRLLGVFDVAEILGVSDRTVWRLAQLGTIPKPFHVGRGARWFEEELNASIRRLADETEVS
jgi:predicted DNA-binding transcriptional regulator AlpA